MFPEKISAEFDLVFLLLMQGTGPVNPVCRAQVLLKRVNSPP